MIVKVKEPQAVEIARLKPRHILFTYLHLAADPDQAQGLMASGCTAIAYETISDRAGRLPLLAPMSQVAGRMSVDVGAYHLLKPAGGRGLLLGGAPGVLPAKVLILGGGVAVRRRVEDLLLHPRSGGRGPAHRRPRHRLRADPGRRGAQARHPG